MGVAINADAVLYKPVGLTANIASGLIARAVFKQVWQRVAGEQKAPNAIDRSHGLSEIVLAAALQGVIFATVKAIITRASAEGYRWMTGAWPDGSRTAARSGVPGPG